MMTTAGAALFDFKGAVLSCSTRAASPDPQRFDLNYSTQTPATGWAERGNIRR